MDNSMFDKVFSEVMDECEEVLINRNVQYASDSDRLHNFHQAAHKLRTSAVQACNSMRAKQDIALDDLVHNYTKLGKRAYPDLWKEKIIDDINYLILLYALCREAELL